MDALFEISVSLDTKPVDRQLLEVSDDLRDLREALAAAGRYMHESIRRNFAAEGRPAPWKRLSPATVARRIRLGHVPIKILHATGALEEAATEEDARGSVWRLTGDSVELGVNTRVIPYARTHQHGREAISGVQQTVQAHQRRTQSGTVTQVRPHTRTVTLPAIPARPFMLFQPEDPDEIGKIVAETAFGEREV